MKTFIKIIIIGLSLYSCSIEDVSPNEITVLFDMEDNVVKYDSEDWVLNLDPETKNRINKIGLERTEYGFVLKSAFPITSVEIKNKSFKYTVDYEDPFNVKVTNNNDLQLLFYWHEVIELSISAIH